MLLLLCCCRSHLGRFIDLVKQGQLAVAVDNKSFVGLEAVADAVDWLQSGSSSGKVVVQISKDLPSAAAAAKL